MDPPSDINKCVLSCKMAGYRHGTSMDFPFLQEAQKPVDVTGTTKPVKKYVP